MRDLLTRFGRPRNFGRCIKNQQHEGAAVTFPRIVTSLFLRLSRILAYHRRGRAIAAQAAQDIALTPEQIYG
jgi:hypothetical protein